MAKNTRVKPESKPEGAPVPLLLSVLFAIIIPSLEAFHRSITLSVSGARIDSLAIFYVGLGLGICFLWRRLSVSGFNYLSAFVYCVSLWFYLTALIALPLFTNDASDSRWASLVQQGGTIGLVVSALALAFALLGNQRLSAGTGLATLAGLVLGSASLLPMLNLQLPILPDQELAIRDTLSHEDTEISAAVPRQNLGELPSHPATADLPIDDQDKHGRVLEKPEYDPDSELEPLAFVDAELYPKMLPKVAHKGEDHPAIHQASKINKMKLAARNGDSSARTQEATIGDEETSHSNEKNKGRQLTAASKSLREQTAQLAQAKRNAAAARQVAWDYSGSRGPEQWGQLSSAYKLCQEGVEQSPINLTGNWPIEQKIELDYKEGLFKVKDNGHGIELLVERGNYATIRGIRYELKNISFHTPGEHLLEKRSQPMEVQFVHVSVQGELAVIAVLISVGQAQEVYQRVIDHLPARAGEIVRPRNISLNLRQLLPDDLSSFYYPGSQTTPPCAEQVAWHVLSNHVRISLSQIDEFRAKYPLNARPIQPLNYRRAP